MQRRASLVLAAAARSKRTRASRIGYSTSSSFGCLLVDVPTTIPSSIIRSNYVRPFQCFQTQPPTTLNSVRSLSSFSSSWKYSNSSSNSRSFTLRALSSSALQYDDYDDLFQEPPEVAIMNMTTKQLRRACQEHGLNVQGKNKALRKRLKKLLVVPEDDDYVDYGDYLDDSEDDDAYNSDSDGSVVDMPVDDNRNNSNNAASDYTGYTVPMLKEQLRSRGLPVGGRKAELLDRLNAHDAAVNPTQEQESEDGDSDDEYDYGYSHDSDSDDYSYATDNDEDDNDTYTTQITDAATPKRIDLSTVQEKTTCVFDKARNYELVTQQSMLEANRHDDMLLSPSMVIPDESESLLTLLPDHLRLSPLLQGDDRHENRRNLIEIVLDIGRRPTCWIGHKRHFLLPTREEEQMAAMTRTSIDTTSADTDTDTDTNSENDTDETITATVTETSDSDAISGEDGDDDVIDSPSATTSATTTTPAPAPEPTTEPEVPYLVTQQDLEHVLGDLHFGEDNRAGVERSLHRISGVRNRDGSLIGATLRVGRYVPGNAILIADLLFRTNSSILFVGPPGSAKTSILRDAARMLSQDHSVVIVDTSCEIGGAGNIPHECIGMARRMQVKNIHSQASVMVECVQNHTPSVIVIDEIGRRAEVEAALTCKERGVRIMASAHGSLPGLVRNNELCDLVGGVDVVTIGDQTARKQEARGGSGSKLKAERKGPPVFDAVVELKRGHLHEWQVVLQTQTAVDNILAYGKYNAQMRSRQPDGQDGSGIEIQNVVRLADRDEIVDEQSTNRSLSVMSNSYSVSATQQQPFDPNMVHWDDYLESSASQRHSLKSCPVCNKQLKSNKGMMDHATTYGPCRRQLPLTVLTAFHRMKLQKK